jgi:hypothetical protein
MDFIFLFQKKYKIHRGELNPLFNERNFDPKKAINFKLAIF